MSMSSRDNPVAIPEVHQLAPELTERQTASTSARTMSLHRTTEYIEECLAGKKVYGDEFTAAEIEQWFASETSAYADLVRPVGELEYEYHGLNKLHGFSALGNRSFSHCVAFGCARGAEVEPIAGRVGRFTCIEPTREWWRDSIADVPAKFVLPQESGVLPLEDQTCDLLTCLGALHHIPNPTLVLGEMARVLRPDGILLMREPISSMGDWRRPRRGTTANERGFPAPWLRQTLEHSGFTIERFRYCQFPLHAVIRHIVTQPAYDLRWVVLLDWLLATCTAWNCHYHRNRLLWKVAPGSVFVVARKAI